MCIYWKKRHTCGHTSDRPYIEMCRPGGLSNTVCSDIGEDDKLRNSHFPCYACIKGEARAEAIALANAERIAVQQAQEARDVAIRQKQLAEQRAKEERIRREAREKAAREREEEAKIKAKKEQEEEKAKKEGGLWIETGAGKKQKGKRGGVLAFPTMPRSAPAATTMFADKDKKENLGASRMSPKKEGKGPDVSGRAGVWGPTKILSRKENLDAKK